MAVCCSSVCLGFSLFIFIASLVLGVFVVPNILETEVTDQLVLNGNSMLYDLWKESKVSEYNVYIYNIENPNEVNIGLDKPKLEQKGPYKLGLFKEKKNIENVDPNLRFDEREILVTEIDQLPTIGIPDEENVDINVMNVPLFAVLSWAESKDGLLEKIEDNIAEIFGVDNTKPTITVTVRQYLYEGISFCNSGQPDVCNEISIVSDYIKTESGGTKIFSFLKHKMIDLDDISPTPFVIQRGDDEIRNMANTKMWDNKDKLTTWGEEGSGCNEIKGTDGIFYYPFLSKRNDQRTIFDPDICRAITLHSDGTKQIITDDSSTRVYNLASNENAFSEKCFCSNVTKGIQDVDGCLKPGVMEMYNCWGLHFVLSYPHFLYAHSDYQEKVEGLNPNPELHQYNAVLDPFFGFLRGGGKKIQYNMFMRKIEHITTTDELDQPILFPLLWIDQKVFVPASANETVNDLLKKFYFYYTIIDIVRWSLIGFTGLTTFGSLVALIAFSVS